MNRKRIYIFGIIILLFYGLIYYITTNNSSLPAQVADNLLRPLVGEKNTLFLESVYFSIQDKILSAHYSANGQKAPVFSQSTTPVNKNAINSDKMNLSNFPIIKSFPLLADEGVWIPISQDLYPSQVIIARSFVRPDISRPYAVVSFVKMDMKKLAVGAQAGTYYPGGERKIFGPGKVPLSIQESNSLLAVFNGGFQEKDGHYGMIVGNTTYVPLKNNLATLLLYKNGSIQLVNYTGQKLTSDVIAVRQNGPFLIRNSIITPFVEQSLDTWGRTTTNSMYTWRSGLGITKQGNLIYAVGNSLVPKTLAQALLRAGAVDALQLDINPFWVRFILYQAIGKGKYTFTSFISSMQNGGNKYLNGYNKDFFYVYKKS